MLKSILKWVLSGCFIIYGLYLLTQAFQYADFSVPAEPLMSEIYKTRAIPLLPLSIAFIAIGAIYFVVLKQRNSAVFNMPQNSDKGHEERILVEAWMDFCSSKDKPSEEHRNYWAYETIDRLCDEEPEKCLALIIAICSSTNNEFILANVAAGPLEDLLVRNGDRVLDQLELWAQQDHKNRSVLASVWRNNIDDELWASVSRMTQGAKSY